VLAHVHLNENKGKGQIMQDKKNLRIYGNPPYKIAVVHGGPGVAGEMAPVAKELASSWGVLEPLQTVSSLKGQVEELKAILETMGNFPVFLIGFSWGAWLGFIFAASYPSFVKKLLLIGSGPFEENEALKIQKVRLNRLSEAEKKEVEFLIDIINNPRAKDKNKAFARFGAIFSQADAYNPVSKTQEKLDYNIDIFQKVWEEADKIRKRGEFREIAKNIRCPVVAVHGDYDPHPAKGVNEFLCSYIKDYRFILLEKCGHKPWIEKEARDKFYHLLKKELSELDFNLTP
jgi:pimeloyl-ACP methyl ester carboxylesterase